MKICLVCGKRFEADDFCCPVCGHSPELRDEHSAFAPELAAGYDGFEAGFFASLAELEAGNFWFESRNRLLTWVLSRFFPNTETFFEIGCGTGFVLSGFAIFHLLSLGRVDLARLSKAGEQTQPVQIA